MKIRVLRYFLTVVREGNITRAAETLHITQPTLSRQLMQLEEELDTQLIIRGKREIKLTEAGRLLVKRAEEILSLVSKTESEITSDLVTGQVSIGSGESVMTSQVLSKLIRKFHSKYPRVKFDLFTGNASDIKEKVDKGLLDIGLLINPVDTEKYYSIELEEKEKWGILLLKDDPLAAKKEIKAEDLKEANLIISRRSIIENKMANFFASNFADLNFIATYNLIYNALTMVESGLGYALALESSIKIGQSDQICFRPLTPELSSSCVFIWKNQQIFNSTASAFIKLIKSEY
ncbi:LysR family transcriptional regulator [Halanaerobium sp. ST460_2HS_T2]|jgi:DNA-binding transcriptional LysR family regulator|uniref:LysR family transcriptional regulator n=1 Tax=Halanaerobium sp. ST460_2HS_T2 TaxID=2183914 RepID=UPI000DF2E512|nr:LysR family transcriptional regulator [Halanaerobium sp. ST460_2HS_T2]RCW62421.1 DNA-binding transcriptional LysR family regulator [Halanaerobium sp. ST460_2HS_T2]